MARSIKADTVEVFRFKTTQFAMLLAMEEALAVARSGEYGVDPNQVTFAEDDETVRFVFGLKPDEETKP